jgi:hypothetical protein
MAVSIYICAARAVFNVDRLLVQFCGQKEAHYVQRIPAWLAFPSIIRGLRFRVLGLWSKRTALKDGAATISQHAPYETVPPSRRRFFG